MSDWQNPHVMLALPSREQTDKMLTPRREAVRNTDTHNRNKHSSSVNYHTMLEEFVCKNL